MPYVITLNLTLNSTKLGFPSCPLNKTSFSPLISLLNNTSLDIQVQKTVTFGIPTFLIPSCLIGALQVFVPLSTVSAAASNSQTSLCYFRTLASAWGAILGERIGGAF